MSVVHAGEAVVGGGARRPPLRALLDAVPVDDVRELARAALARGHSVDDVVDELARLVDQAVDWTSVLKGPVGVLLEAVDGAIVRKAIRVIVRAVDRARREAA